MIQQPNLLPPKFIQILSHGGSLFALDEGGQIWRREANVSHEQRVYEVTWIKVDGKREGG